MTTETVLNYTINCDQKEFAGKLKYTVQVLNNNAKKHPLIYNYYFQNEINRDQWISNFKSNVSNHANKKQERKDQIKNFINPAKIGDILNASWGYDQTNNDFYQVVGIKGQYIEIKPIAQARDYDVQSMAGHTIPIKDHFIEVTYEKLNRIYKVKPGYSSSYCIGINSYKTAYPVNPSEKHYFSTYA